MTDKENQTKDEATVCVNDLVMPLNLDKEQSRAIWNLVQACYEEVLDKELMDVLEIEEGFSYNEDYHVHPTLTFKEVRDAARAIGFKPA